MDYNKDDLKNIRYDVTTKEYLKKYPELKQYKVFDPKHIPDLDFNKVFTYIACTYDKQSPLIHSAPNLMSRKMEAAKIASFPFKDGVMEAGYEMILRCKNAATNAMIIQYCRGQNDIDYTSLVTYTEKFYDQQNKMLSDTEDEKTKDLIDNSEKLKTHIKNTQYQILADDNLELTQDLAEQIESELLELRPESIAKKISRGEKI